MNTNPPAHEAPIRIGITIPTNVYFLSGLRNFTLDMAKNVAGFDEQWAYRFQTVVDELTNNAIEHGSREGDDINLLFEVEHQKSMRVTIADSGHGPQQFTADELNKKITTAREHVGKPSLALRGRGFMLISSWCDEFVFSDNDRGGISATAMKTYQPDELAFRPQHAHTQQNVFVLEV